MYKVIKAFVDKTNHHGYKVGDIFPGNVSEERLAELSSAKNNIGEPLIKFVKEEKKETQKGLFK